MGVECGWLNNIQNKLKRHEKIPLSTDCTSDLSVVFQYLHMHVLTSSLILVNIPVLHVSWFTLCAMLLVTLSTHVTHQNSLFVFVCTITIEKFVSLAFVRIEYLLIFTGYINCHGYAYGYNVEVAQMGGLIFTDRCASAKTAKIYIVQIFLQFTVCIVSICLTLTVCQSY